MVVVVVVVEVISLSMCPARRCKPSRCLSEMMHDREDWFDLNKVRESSALDRSLDRDLKSFVAALLLLRSD